LIESLLDSAGRGRAGQRDVYENGVQVRIDLDTDADGQPDVIQYLRGESVVRQDEDSDHDGVIDRRFEGDRPLPIDGRPSVPGELPKLDCGKFDPFWNRR
jgi:hypothetical protein